MKWQKDTHKYLPLNEVQATIDHQKLGKIEIRRSIVDGAMFVLQGGKTHVIGVKDIFEDYLTSVHGETDEH